MDKGFVWCVGGGQMSLPMCQEIKRRGYSLLLTDLDPACPCRPLADRFAPVSVYGVKDNLNFARYGLHVKPVAVLTAGTDAGAEVAVLAHHFGLPGTDPKVAYIVHSKIALRQALDMLHPQYAVGTAGNFLDWDIYPCVVKAANASGSKGFSLVSKVEEMPGAISKAILANRGGSQVLVEELLKGQDTMPEFSEFDTSEASIEGFVVDGRWVYANGALRLFDRSRAGIEAGHFNPFEVTPEITALAQMAAERLGVTSGVLKLDLKLDRRYGWCILEAAVRLSGGYDSSFTSPLATGRDVYGAALDLALGLPLDPGKLENKKGRVACCLAPVHKPGKISGWQTPDGAIVQTNKTGFMNEQGEGFIFYRTNTEIKPLESNADRPVFVIADGVNHQEAYETARGLAERVRPIYV